MNEWVNEWNEASPHLRWQIKMRWKCTKFQEVLYIRIDGITHHTTKNEKEKKTKMKIEIELNCSCNEYSSSAYTQRANTFYSHPYFGYFICENEKDRAANGRQADKHTYEENTILATMLHAACICNSFPKSKMLIQYATRFYAVHSECVSLCLTHCVCVCEKKQKSQKWT